VTLVPRSVLVERPTEFRDLLARHGTREQARFFLAQRGRPIDDVEERHLRYEEVRARVIGGLQMIDGGEADDKIIAVLENDYVWGTARDIGDVPPVLVERLQHYFLTYKLVPGEPVHATIGKIYGLAHARRVVRAAMADYTEAFGVAPRSRRR